MTPYYDHGGVTIYHADAREVMADLTADVLITDPPYGVCFSHRLQNEPAITGEQKMNRASDRQLTDAHVAVRNEVLRQWGTRPALVFGSWRAPRPPATLLRLVWDKGQIGMGGFGPWRPADEEIYVLGKGWLDGDRNTPTVIRCAPEPTAHRNHPTPKPLSLMKRCVSWCPPDWTILDPFMGSGTTLRAAKDLGRRAIGVEIEERYCEVAAKRLGQEVLWAS